MIVAKKFLFIYILNLVTLYFHFCSCYCISNENKKILLKSKNNTFISRHLMWVYLESIGDDIALNEIMGIRTFYIN